jgi:hypothetical protein
MPRVKVFGRFKTEFGPQRPKNRSREADPQLTSAEDRMFERFETPKDLSSFI